MKDSLIWRNMWLWDLEGRRCELSYIGFSIHKCPGTWKNSELSPCIGLWNFKLYSLYWFWVQKSESSYINFSLYKCSGNWKNSELHRKFRALPSNNLQTWKNSELFPLYWFWIQKGETPSKARYESSYISFSLYKCLGTWKNFVLSSHIIKLWVLA